VVPRDGESAEPSAAARAHTTTHESRRIPGEGTPLYRSQRIAEAPERAATSAQIGCEIDGHLALAPSTDVRRTCDSARAVVCWSTRVWCILYVDCVWGSWAAGSCGVVGCCCRRSGGVREEF
jgi:hypothetical protein